MDDNNNNGTKMTTKKQLSFQGLPQIQLSTTLETSFGGPKQAPLAVRARNICLSYRQSHTVNFVLNGINMSVPKGSIYGLLGPSGCGKTSLLSLLIGLRQPECGTISLYGFRPGTKQSGVPGPGVGFMPQDIALQSDLTIEEMLTYFGRLYCMDEEYLEQQISYLVTLLQLPSKKRLIANLSGGQQRRVSLAVTLIHKPRLVILDEPTVGVDPLLCRTIWDLLVHLVKTQNMSIIITTHYIEECRRANVVGFMRKGQILAEDSPDALMKRHQVESLEAVFYSLCFGQKERKSMVARTDISRRKSVMDETSGLGGGEIVYGTREAFVPKVDAKLKWYIFMIRTLIWKYIIQTLREPGATMIMFFFPSFALGMLCLCIGGTPFDVPVAWVVDEPRIMFNSNPSLALPIISNPADDKSTENTDIDISNPVDDKSTENTDTVISNPVDDKSTESTDTDDPSDTNNSSEDEEIPYLPDLLYSSLDHKILKLINYTDLDSARKDMKSGKIWGAIHLSRNFSRAYRERDLFLGGEDWVDNTTIDMGTIQIHGDFTDKFMTLTVELSVQLALVNFTQKATAAYGLNPNVAKLPFGLGEVIYGSSLEGDYFGVRDFAAPGFLVCLAYAVSYAISMLSIISEIHDEMFSRNYAAGLTSFQIVIGQVVARFIFLGTASEVLLISTVYLFNVPCKGSFLVASALLLLITLCGLTQGMVMGTIIPNIFACCFVTTGMFLLIFFVSGVFWPLESLPYYLSWLSRTQPFTLPAECLRSVLIRQNAPFHPLIWPGFAISIFWLIVFVTLCVLLFRAKK